LSSEEPLPHKERLDGIDHKNLSLEQASVMGCLATLPISRELRHSLTESYLGKGQSSKGLKIIARGMLENRFHDLYMKVISDNIQN
jgi:hypothetical protein